MSLSRNSGWLTLSQRLSALVHNQNHPIGKSFKAFCESLELTYRKKLRSVENFAFYGSNNFTINNSTRFLTSFEDFYVISEQDLGLNKVYLEDQTNFILAHLYHMTESLVEYFGNHKYMFIRKIRLCYEKCFFNQIGRDLVLIYRVVYGKSMHTLEHKASRLKEIEIDKLGLQMKDEWWLELFENRKKRSFKYSDDNSLINGNGSLRNSESDFDSVDGEFGDDEDITDYESDEYSSDVETNDSKKMFYKFKALKDGLNKSKQKVLSRSLENLTGKTPEDKDWVSKHAAMLKEDISSSTNKARPRFDTNAFSRYLEDEIELTELVPKLGYGGLRKAASTSSIFMRSTEDDSKDRTINKSLRKPKDSFELHFGKAIESIRNIFTNSSPLKKMQCLTTALRLVANKVEELRMRGKDPDKVERSKYCVTAEDLLPLIVLLLLKMSASEIAKLYTEIIFVSDMMADFLTSGCHSYALCEFQIAYRVLDQTCEELCI